MICQVRKSGPALKTQPRDPTFFNSDVQDFKLQCHLSFIFSAGFSKRIIFSKLSMKVYELFYHSHYHTTIIPLSLLFIPLPETPVENEVVWSMFCSMFFYVHLYGLHEIVKTMQRWWEMTKSSEITTSSSLTVLHRLTMNVSHRISVHETNPFVFVGMHTIIYHTIPNMV